MLIGLVGKLQSGKTSVANIIKEIKPSIVKVSFADLLKEMVFNAGLCTKEELWGEKTAFSRLMLQKIGTEIIRKQVSENFWVDAMEKEIKLYSNVIIDDVRFLNEAEMVKSFDGTLLKITRPDIIREGNENNHLSETEQDSIYFNYEIINDGSLNDLKDKSIDLLKKFESYEHHDVLVWGEKTLKGKT